MDPFAQAVALWQTFYATVVASSATLVGLLFVSLALRSNTLTPSSKASTRILARQTFTSFLYIIGIGLTFLIPQQERRGVGIPLIAVGIAGLVIVVSDIRSIRASTESSLDKRNSFVRSLLKGIALLILIVLALMLSQGADTQVLWWLVFPVIFLLLSASYDTWLLMVAIQTSSSES